MQGTTLYGDATGPAGSNILYAIQSLPISAIVTDSYNYKTLAIGYSGIMASFDSGYLPGEPGHRLSAVSGDPTGDGAGGILYYVPYKNSIIHLRNSDVGLGWVAISTANSLISLNISGVSDGVYDVFAKLSGGFVALELSTYAWFSDTIRVDTLAQLDGAYCLNGDPGRRYVGTVYIKSGLVKNNKEHRHIYNYYNKVQKTMYVIHTDAFWQGDGSSSWKLPYGVSIFSDLVVGQEDMHVTSDLFCFVDTAGISPTRYGAVGIGIDSTTVNSAQVYVSSGPSIATAFVGPISAKYYGAINIGLHKIYWLENSDNAAVTFYGTSAPYFQKSGLTTSLMI